MIYIIEGMHGAGKTTYAKTLKLPIKKQSCTTLEAIKKELSSCTEDIIYDRLFIDGFARNNVDDYKLMEVNNYLKSRPDVVCIKKLLDAPNSFDIFYDRWHNWPGFKNKTKEELYDIFKPEFDYTEHALNIMDCFKEE